METNMQTEMTIWERSVYWLGGYTMKHYYLQGCFVEIAVTNNEIWGFLKIRGTIVGVLIIRTIVYWGLYWGPPISGNYHIAWS